MGVGVEKGPGGIGQPEGGGNLFPAEKEVAQPWACGRLEVPGEGHPSGLGSAHLGVPLPFSLQRLCWAPGATCQTGLSFPSCLNWILGARLVPNGSGLGWQSGGG